MGKPAERPRTAAAPAGEGAPLGVVHRGHAGAKGGQRPTGGELAAARVIPHDRVSLRPPGLPRLLHAVSERAAVRGADQASVNGGRPRAERGDHRAHAQAVAYVSAPPTAITAATRRKSLGDRIMGATVTRDGTGRARSPTEKPRRTAGGGGGAQGGSYAPGAPSRRAWYSVMASRWTHSLAALCRLRDAGTTEPRSLMKASATATWVKGSWVDAWRSSSVSGSSRSSMAQATFSKASAGQRCS